MPLAAQMLLSHWSERAWAGAPILRMDMPGVPRSLNHQYLSGRGGRKYLDPKVRDYRKDVLTRIVESVGWRPTGKVAALIVLSTQWVKKDGTIRETDIDNRVKALLDALQEAITGFQDHSVWEFAAFKQHTLQGESTIVYLFDLGDLVPTLPYP